MEIIPNFAVLEGGDGSGTTTQLSMLSKRLQEIKFNGFYTTFEPTDRQIGKLIRLALKKEINLQPQSLAFLFAADRNEHLNAESGIMERVKKGELVISDRYFFSSLVYQGIECGDDLPESLNLRFGVPELTLFLDIEPETAIERMKERANLEIYENIEFQRKVREKYKSLIDIYRSSGARIEVIDAGKSPQEVSDQIWSKITSMPIFKIQ